MSTPSIPKRYTIIVIVVLTLIVAFLVKTQEKVELTLQPKPPVQVQVLSAERRLIRVTEPITGRLQPARVAKLRFELAGRISTRKIEPGQFVKQNDTLLTLDSYDVDDNLVDAKSQWKLEYSEIEKDKVLLALAKRHVALQAAEVERLERLKKNAMASRTAVDEAKQKLLNLEKDSALLQQKAKSGPHKLQLKQAAVSRAQRNVERTQLKAPYDSVVNIVNAGVGDYVTANSVVVELADLSALDLLVEVSPTVAGHLQMGQKVDVALADEVIIGKIHAIQVSAKDDTNTHPVKVRIPATKYLPGTIATVSLLLEQRDMLVLPPEAIQSRFGDHFVFVYQDGKIKRKLVTLGVRQGQWQEVLSGISAEDQVVANNLERLSDHQRAELQTSVVGAP